MLLRGGMDLLFAIFPRMNAAPFTFSTEVRHLFEGGVYSRAAFITLATFSDSLCVCPNFLTAFLFLSSYASATIFSAVAAGVHYFSPYVWKNTYAWCNHTHRYNQLIEGNVYFTQAW